jgi:hypothetical protein
MFLAKAQRGKGFPQSLPIFILIMNLLLAEAQSSQKKCFSQRREGAKRQRFPAEFADLYFNNEFIARRGAEFAEKNVSRKDAKAQRGKGFPQSLLIFILIMNLLLAEAQSSQKKMFLAKTRRRKEAKVSRRVC